MWNMFKCRKEPDKNPRIDFNALKVEALKVETMDVSVPIGHIAKSIILDLSLENVHRWTEDDTMKYEDRWLNQRYFMYSNNDDKRNYTLRIQDSYEYDSGGQYVYKSKVALLNYVSVKFTPGETHKICDSLSKMLILRRELAMKKAGDDYRIAVEIERRELEKLFPILQ